MASGKTVRSPKFDHNYASSNYKHKIEHQSSTLDQHNGPICFSVKNNAGYCDQADTQARWSAI